MKSIAAGPLSIECLFYLKYSGTPKYGNVIGNSLPVGLAHQKTESYLKYSGLPQERNTLCIFLKFRLRKVVPGNTSGNNIQRHGMPDLASRLGVHSNKVSENSRI